MLSNAWTRSSRCNADSPRCVLVAPFVEADGTTRVHVRDSKEGDDGTRLSYTSDEWRAFVEGVKAGEFDL